MRRTPLRASRNPSQSSSREFPNGVMHPKPLTTIRSRRAFRLRLKATEKSYTAPLKSAVFHADKTIGRPVMDILPVDNLTRPIDTTRHQDREQPQRRRRSDLLSLSRRLPSLRLFAILVMFGFDGSR